MMALGVLEGLRQCGISVPEDVAIIGSDNIPMGKWFRPNLTTVGIDYDSIIELTVRWILAMTEGRLPNSYRHVLSSKLIIRDTFCPE